MKCRKCGTENTSDLRFCRNCGRELHGKSLLIPILIIVSTISIIAVIIFKDSVISAPSPEPVPVVAEKGVVEKTPSTGDYNGDGKLEIAVCVPPEDLNWDEQTFNENSKCRIVFTDDNIPLINVGKYILGGKLQNLGDLNGDGKDEIGLWQYGFTSCWHSYYVWTLKGEGWTYLIEPFKIHCCLWEEKGEDFLPVVRRGNNQIEIYYNDELDEDNCFETKSSIIDL